MLLYENAETSPISQVGVETSELKQRLWTYLMPTCFFPSSIVRLLSLRLRWSLSARTLRYGADPSPALGEIRGKSDNIYKKSIRPFKLRLQTFHRFCEVFLKLQ